MSKLMDSIKEKARQANKRIVLAEGEEERIILAAEKITKEKIARVTLLGDINVIKNKCPNADLTNIDIINPKNSEAKQKYADLFYELRKNKGVTPEQAYAITDNSLYYGVLMIKSGDCDGMVAGSINSTGDVLRPALQVIKTAKGISTVSSCFIMCLPDGCEYGEDGIMVFGDCAVNINPSKEELAAIAIASASSAKNIAGINPKVAMLSFSTKGSAKHEFVDKVREATEIVKTLVPDIEIDGELQADAALVSSVGALKSPGSSVAGQANVLIFPDLQAGNIGYKLVQRLAKAEAIGPICQGMAMPVNDLSRGCNVEDVVCVAAITAVQAIK